MAFLARKANLARTLPEKTSGSAKYAATTAGSVDISFGSTAGAMRAIGISDAAIPEMFEPGSVGSQGSRRATLATDLSGRCRT